MVRLIASCQPASSSSRFSASIVGSNTSSPARMPRSSSTPLQKPVARPAR